MNEFQTKVHELYSLELLSARNTAIHRLHPLAKIIGVLTYIVAVVSMNRYAVFGLVPYVFFPMLMMALGEIPYGMVLKRSLIALPFCFFAGISNVIFDRQPVASFGSFILTAGELSLATIIFRTLLCVSAVLILVGITPFQELTAQLRRFRIPNILVMLLEITYRYIGALSEEAGSMYTAYRLRSPEKKGVELRHMGAFVGQLLIRSFDRAERIYSAMQCRGYPFVSVRFVERPLRLQDWMFLSLTCGFSILFRFVNFTVIFGRWFA